MRGGDTKLAREALERLAATTQPCGTDFALGIEARCRALVSEGETAERLYQAAIRRLGRTQLRPELARALLVHGEWLRRENHRPDAREQLRTAHEMFAAMGWRRSPSAHAMNFKPQARLGAVAMTAAAKAVGAADRRDARRSNRTGAADRAARPRRPVESRDRRAALPEPAHRRVAPAQRVQQAWDPVPTGAGRRIAER